MRNTAHITHIKLKKNSHIKSDFLIICLYSRICFRQQMNSGTKQLLPFIRTLAACSFSNYLFKLLIQWTANVLHFMKYYFIIYVQQTNKQANLIIKSILNKAAPNDYYQLWAISYTFALLLSTTKFYLCI